MEDEIKVGDYVRTKGYGIGKILEIKTVKTKMDGNHDKSYKLDIFKNIWFSKTNFINHSFESIDLIEAGDYVNGIYIEKNKGKYLETLETDGELSSLGHIEYIKIYPKDIESIVTKEQFESMEYKVKG